MITSVYFQLANTIIGEVYFRVSKHLGWRVSKVIKHKYEPDIKFLILKYTSIIRQEQKEYKELKNKSK